MKSSKNQDAVLVALDDIAVKAKTLEQLAILKKKYKDLQIAATKYQQEIADKIAQCDDMANQIVILPVGITNSPIVEASIDPLYFEKKGYKNGKTITNYIYKHAPCGEFTNNEIAKMMKDAGAKSSIASLSKSISARMGKDSRFRNVRRGVWIRVFPGDRKYLK